MTAVAEAGLAGLAVVAGSAIIAEPAEVARRADELGVFVLNLILKALLHLMCNLSGVDASEHHFKLRSLSGYNGVERKGAEKRLHHQGGGVLDEGENVP